MRAVSLAIAFAWVVLRRPTLSTAFSLPKRRPTLASGAFHTRSIPKDAVDTDPPLLLPLISDVNTESSVNSDKLSCDAESRSLPTRSTSFPAVLWRFTRPHTLIGSATAVPSLFLLASPTYRSFFSWRTFAVLMHTTISALLMNVYITGLNQITDVEIDKINVSNLSRQSPSIKLR